MLVVAHLNAVCRFVAAALALRFGDRQDPAGAEAVLCLGGVATYDGAHQFGVLFVGVLATRALLPFGESILGLLI